MLHEKCHPEMQFGRGLRVLTQIMPNPRKRLRPHNDDQSETETESTDTNRI